MKDVAALRHTLRMGLGCHISSLRRCPRPSSDMFVITHGSFPLPPQVLNPAKPRQFWSTDQHRDTFEPMLRFRRYTSSRLTPVTHSLLSNLPGRMSGWSIFRKLYRKKRKASAIEISEPCDVISSVRMAPIAVPESQTVLLLREPRQPYELVKHYPTPELHTGSEVLVKTRAIGLNPIDWKAP